MKSAVKVTSCLLGFWEHTTRAIFTFIGWVYYIRTTTRVQDIISTVYVPQSSIFVFWTQSAQTNRWSADAAREKLACRKNLAFYGIHLGLYQFLLCWNLPPNIVELTFVERSKHTTYLSHWGPNVAAETGCSKCCHPQRAELNPTCRVPEPRQTAMQHHCTKRQGLQSCRKAVFRWRSSALDQRHRSFVPFHRSVFLHNVCNQMISDCRHFQLSSLEIVVDPGKILLHSLPGNNSDRQKDFSHRNRRRHKRRTYHVSKSWRPIDKTRHSHTAASSIDSCEIQALSTVTGTQENPAEPQYESTTLTGVRISRVCQDYFGRKICWYQVHLSILQS